jgi:hypothetical protein
MNSLGRFKMLWGGLDNVWFLVLLVAIAASAVASAALVTRDETPVGAVTAHPQRCQ